jgi:4-hydroxybenzoate polyprenyltransferase
MGEKNKTRLWSVISLSLAVLALVLCFLGWVGMALCTIALAFAIISRKMLGYFDRITLASLIVSIFAMVFSIVFTVMNSIS